MTRRSTLAGTALFCGAAAFTLWQNAHIAVLWDLAYLLDSSWRIALGQVPYRDFPFAHAPLTFLIQAAIIKFFGRVYWHHVLYAALANGVAVLLTWRIALRLLHHRLLSTLLAATLIPLGIYSIYPHPIYDSDCILSVLVALYLLDAPLIAGPERSRRIADGLGNFAAGIACVLPLFFKQNIGLLFFAAVLSSVLAIAIARKLRREPIAPPLAFFAGAALALTVALLLLHRTVSLANYRYWTLTFAAQRRLPGLGLILGIYHQTSLLWSIPAALIALLLLRFRSGRRATIAAFALLAAPFLYAAITFFLTDDSSDRADALLSLWPHLLLLSVAFALWQLHRPLTPTTLLPLILLATIHGAFLSQQLWGSTYALWPLLVLLLACMLAAGQRQHPRLATTLTLTIGATFLLCGTLYSLSRERLSYSHLDGSLVHATLPALRGLSTPGDFVSALEDLIAYTKQTIPANDGIVLMPGQDPFYFATGRAPRFPVLLLDPATNPYSPAQLRDEARRRNIRWLIVSRDLQLTADPVLNLPDYISTLTPDFTLAKTLNQYDIYVRKQP